jgi:hypothetical protein
MKDLFTFESVQSETRNDLWVLTLGPNVLTMPYRQGFEVLTAILLACKMAMNYEQVASKHWRELANLTTWRDEAGTVTHRGFRSSNEIPSVKNCDVAYENNLVRLEFYPTDGGAMLTAKVHFADAFALYRGGRIACRAAKMWAGDSSRIYGGHAALRDAEHNDKLIVH